MTRDIGHLHVITDTSLQSQFTHIELCQMAIEGGASTIQYRDKMAARYDRLKNIEIMVKLCVEANVTLMVNDDPALAREGGADGVHVGQSDASVTDARIAVGQSRIVGATANSLEAALAAQRYGATYIGFGHIFTTHSKQKNTPPVGLDSLSEVCAAVDIPVIAIGGITVDNASSVLDVGAGGIAVIGAICCAPDPVAATRSLVELMAQR